MTINQVIEAVDRLKPNAFTQPEKIKWLSDIDMMIWHEIVLTHEKGDDMPDEFNGYTPATSTSTQLLIGSPYDTVYVAYVEAQIDKYNMEIDKYNNSVTEFNSRYQIMRNAYNRDHKPLERGRWKV